MAPFLGRVSQTHSLSDVQVPLTWCSVCVFPERLALPPDGPHPCAERNTFVSLRDKAHFVQLCWNSFPEIIYVELSDCQENNYKLDFDIIYSFFKTYSVFKCPIYFNSPSVNS